MGSQRQAHRRDHMTDREIGFRHAGKIIIEQREPARFIQVVSLSSFYQDGMNAVEPLVSRQ